MEIEWTLVWPLLGVLVLAILITGPGMWSDVWGHGWLERRKGSHDPAGRPPSRGTPR